MSCIDKVKDVIKKLHKFNLLFEPSNKNAYQIICQRIILHGNITRDDLAIALEIPTKYLNNLLNINTNKIYFLKYYNISNINTDINADELIQAKIRSLINEVIHTSKIELLEKQIDEIRREFDAFKAQFTCNNMCI